MKKALAVAGALITVPTITTAVAEAAERPVLPLAADLAGHTTAGSHMRAEAAELERRRLARRVRTLEGRLARLRGEKLPSADRYAAMGRSQLRDRIDRARREIAAERRRGAGVPAAPGAPAGPTAAAPHLQAIAACESGGNPRAIGGGGAYRGKYQFSYETWAAVGGSGDPAAAPEAEQDRRAAILYARAGSSPWPVCG